MRGQPTNAAKKGKTEPILTKTYDKTSPVSRSKHFSGEKEEQEQEQERNRIFVKTLASRLKSSCHATHSSR